MRISDWSSDVCSSDLKERTGHPVRQTRESQTRRLAPPCVPRRSSGRVGLCHATFPCLAKTKRIRRLISRSSRTAGGNSPRRWEEHTSELQSRTRISYAVFNSKKKNIHLMTKKHKR